MKSLFKFNIFTFFTTLAKTTVEVFIPILLYKYGESIREIMIFFIACFILNVIIAPLVSLLGEKIGFKWIVFISAFLFVLQFYSLEVFPNIYLLALLYSLNNSFYYLGKHNYTTGVLDSKKLGSGVGSILIVTIIAAIPASYFGSILLDKGSVYLTMIIVLVIYLIGVIPLFFIKQEKHIHERVLDTIKKLPMVNHWYFASTQFKIVFFLLYPLYIFINVKAEFSFIGKINAVVGVSSIIFIYFYAKVLDKKKSDYMLFAAMFLTIILFLEINTKSSMVLLLISFIEGIATKLYETSVAKDFYFVPKDVSHSCYFLIYEIFNNLVKAGVLMMLLIFSTNLKLVLIILLGGIMISGFIKFKNPLV